jgi:hypothetical protein
LSLLRYKTGGIEVVGAAHPTDIRLNILKKIIAGSFFEEGFGAAFLKSCPKNIN